MPSLRTVNSNREPVNRKRPAEVKLQFVSPVEETVGQAESEINTEEKRAKPSKRAVETLPRQPKVQDIVKASADRLHKKSSTRQAQKGKASDSKKFSYRTLNDIFSASR